MKCRSSSIARLAIVLFVFLVACNLASGPGSSAATDPSTNTTVSVDTSQVEIRPNVKVLTAEESAIAIVGVNTVAFPVDGHDDLASLPVGTILVGSHGEGFLRRIEAVKPRSTVGALQPQSLLGDVVAVFETSIASLADVFNNLDTSVDVKPAPLSLDQGLELGNAYFKVRFGKVKTEIAPETKLRLKLVQGEPVLMSADVAIKGRLEVQAGIEAEAKYQMKDDQVLWTSPSIPVRFALGPVPIVSSLRFSVVLHAKASATAKVSSVLQVACSRTATTHLKWTKDDGPSSESERTDDCEALPDPMGSMRLGEDFSIASDLGVELRAEWNFFSLASVMVGAEVHAKQSIEQCPPPAQYKLTSVLNGRVGADFRPFGIKVAEFSKEGLPTEKVIRKVDVFSDAASMVTSGGSGSDTRFNFTCAGCVREGKKVSTDGFYRSSIVRRGEGPLQYINNVGGYQSETRTIPLYVDITTLDARHSLVRFVVDAPPLHTELMTLESSTPTTPGRQAVCSWGSASPWRYRPAQKFCYGGSDSGSGDPACGPTGPLVSTFVAETFQRQNGECRVRESHENREPQELVLDQNGKLSCGADIGIACPAVCTAATQINAFYGEIGGGTSPIKERKVTFSRLQ